MDVQLKLLSTIEVSTVPFVTGDGEAPLRLTLDYFRARSATSQPPAPIIRSEDGGYSGRIFLEREKKPFLLAIALGIPAESFNTLTVTMRADAGAEASISWKADTSSYFPDAKAITIPIISDNAFHSYRVALTDSFDSSWSGTIQSMEFIPSDVPAEVEIKSIALAWEPPSAPRRITLNAQTHESFIGAPPEWRFIVPPSAQFEAYVGLSPNASARSEGTFRVYLREGGVEDTLIAETTVNATKAMGYLPLRADLSSYAGRKVTLRFASETIPAHMAVSNVWGNPVVYNRENDERPPVILISIDTLRADHMSIYGYDRNTTPNLDRFAKDAVVFDRAFCQETYTLSSHMTMLTGLYPKHHVTTPFSSYREDRITLTELLRDAGYLTAAFTGFRNWLKPEFGFAQGFDLYNTPDSVRRTVFETHALTEDWLRAADRPNLFLFVHNYDVHGYRRMGGPDDVYPYGPTDPKFRRYSIGGRAKALAAAGGLKAAQERYAEAFWGREKLSPDELGYMRALYDDTIVMVDSALGELFAVLKERGLYDEALIIVTSDHGESLGDVMPSGRQLFEHGWVYDDTAQVPLIVKFPNERFAGRHYKPHVQLIDLAPTVLACAGLPVPDWMDGASLIDLLNGSAEPAAYVYTQRHVAQSVRDGTWKLILDTNLNSYELFKIPADPLEVIDHYPDSPPAGESLEQELHDFYDSVEDGWHIYWRRPPDSSPNPGIRISATEPFVDLEFYRGDRLEWLNDEGDKPYIQRTGRTTTINLGRLRDEHIHIRMPSADSSLQLELLQADSIQLALGDNAPQTVSTWQAILQPEDVRTDAPGQLPDADDALPLLVIQYVQSIDTDSGDSPLTEEEREELEGLGYLQ